VPLSNLSRPLAGTVTFVPVHDGGSVAYGEGLRHGRSLRQLTRADRLALGAGVPPRFDRQLPRQLGREDVDRLDDRRLRQQLGRLGHQGGRDSAAEVRLAPRVVGESVEDAELRGSKTIANQAMVAGSSSTRAKPPSRKLITSASLPGLTTKRTSKPHCHHRRSPFDGAASPQA
jgi:hypothetical protein